MNPSRCLLVLSAGLLLLHFVIGYPNRAPPSKCLFVVPHHGSPSKLQPQDSPAPFRIHAHPARYQPNDKINVTIVGTEPGVFFRGFQLRARSQQGDWAVAYGTFSNIPAGALGQSFYGEANSCVSHSDNRDRQSISFTWTAPNISVGDIYFFGGVVKNYQEFWVDISSNTVAADTSPPAWIRTVKMEAPESNIRVSIDGCGDSYGCMYQPQGCTGLGDCTAIAKFKQLSNSNFELQLWTRGYEWVALAFSDDRKMGGDLMYYCMVNSGVRVVAKAINPSYYTNVHPPRSMPKYEVGTNEEEVWCHLEIPETITLSDLVMNVSAENFLFLTSGHGYDGTIDIRQHVILPIISHGRESLRSTEIMRTASLPVVIQAHAVLSVLAWLFFATCGAVLARHRVITANHTCFNVLTWFQVHRAVATLAVVCSIAAIVTMFASLKRFTYFARTHASVGLAVGSLAVIQIFIALLRPDPTSARRIVFNWIHRIAGVLSLLGAVVTVVLALLLPELPSGLRRGIAYSLAVWFVLLLITECIMEVQRCRTTQSKDLELNDLAKIPGERPREELKRDGARRWIVAFYCLFVALSLAPIISICYFIIRG